MKKYLSTLFLFCIFTFSSTAQTEIKWNKIPKEDLKMTVYEPESDADAVILAKTVSADFRLTDKGIVMYYQHHIRIKILKESGKKHADIIIPYYGYRKFQQIKNLKAQTINLENGKETKYVLSRKDFFEEEYSKYYTSKKFTFPKVQVGSIIEYQYTLTEQRLTTPRDFYFQEELPVRWAAFNIKVPKVFDYISMERTYQDYALREDTQTNVLLQVGYTVPGFDRKWAMQHVPSMKEEAFISTMDDYRQRIRLQLASYEDQNGIKKDFITNWPQMKKELDQNDDFGNRMKRKGQYKTVKADCFNIVKPHLTAKKKMLEIYDFVSRSIEWDGSNSMFVDRSFDDIYTSKKGDNAEINMTLLVLLREADITAYPVLLSTRDHGKPTTIYPILKQFNCMIVQATIGDETYLLDATNPNRSHELLNLNTLNREGWVVKNSGEWIAITPSTSRKVINFQVNLSKEGTLSGLSNSIYTGYNAYEMRSTFHNDGKVKYLEERIKDDFPNIQIDSSSFKNIDLKDKRFEERLFFTIPEVAEIGGDMIYFNPIVGKTFNENPFKLEERNYPVDIAYPFKNQYVMSVKIPDGYSVEELPESIQLNLLDGAGSFSFLTNELPNSMLQIVSKVELKQTYYSTEEYPYIKQFFDMIIEKQNALVVLKKTP